MCNKYLPLNLSKMYVSVKKIKNYKISVKAIVVKILENKKILSQKLGFSKNSRYLKRKKKKTWDIGESTWNLIISIANWIIL